MALCMLFPWLGLLHTLMFPANTIHSSRVISGHHTSSESCPYPLIPVTYLNKTCQFCVQSYTNDKDLSLVPRFLLWTLVPCEQNSLIPMPWCQHRAQHWEVFTIPTEAPRPSRLWKQWSNSVPQNISTTEGKLRCGRLMREFSYLKVLMPNQKFLENWLLKELSCHHFSDFKIVQMS